MMTDFPKTPNHLKTQNWAGALVRAWCVSVCLMSGFIASDTCAAEQRIFVMEPAAPMKIDQETLYKIVMPNFPQTRPPEERMPNRTDWKPDPCVISCFASMQYRYYTGGRYEKEPINFRLRFPPHYDSNNDKKYPLIVFLHGARDGGGDNQQQLVHFQCMLETLLGPGEFFMMATACPIDNLSWTSSISSEGKGDSPMTINHEVLEALVEEYPIDRDRISLCGASAGASAAWTYALKYPDYFSALVPFSSGGPGSLPQTQRLTKTTVLSYNNDASTRDVVREATEYINRNDNIAYLRENVAGGHTSWYGGFRDDKVIDWMIQQDRGLLAGPPPNRGFIPHDEGYVFWRFFLPIGLILAVMFSYGVIWLINRRIAVHKYLGNTGPSVLKGILMSRAVVR